MTCWQCEDRKVVQLRKDNEKLKTIIEGLLKITPDTRYDEPVVIDALAALDDD
jgi:succinylglutamate desuccinylase